MPCVSDYLNPSDRERRLQDTARLYVYALEHLGRNVPSSAKAAAGDIYCKKDFVPVLCGLLRGLELKSPKVFNQLVYNAKSKNSRDLANWWEEHEAADREREQREQEEVIRQEHRRSGLSKLTLNEARALGLTLAPGDVLKKPSKKNS